MKIVVSYWGHTPKRITKIVIGDTYEYQPINPSATRNRGRQGTLLEYDNDQYRTDLSKNATIKWLDTKRSSQVDIGGFIHIDDVYKTDLQRANEAQEYILSRLL
ncbi:MAG: hypothetical protein WCW84_13070 [Sulfurimonas sp.]